MAVLIKKEWRSAEPTDGTVRLGRVVHQSTLNGLPVRQHCPHFSSEKICHSGLSPAVLSLPLSPTAYDATP